MRILRASDLLPIESGSGNTFFRPLVQIRNLFFRLHKRESDLFLRQLHQVSVDALQNQIYAAPGQSDVVFKSLFVGVRIDVRLLQEYEVDTFIIQVFVGSKAFLCIAAHSGHTVEDDSISFFDLTDKLHPFFSIHPRSCENLLNDDRIRIGGFNISNLAFNALLWPGNPAVSISHSCSLCIGIDPRSK